MNKQIWLAASMLCSLSIGFTGCSDDTAPETPETDTWNAALSRAETGGENVTVALRYGETTSYGTLIPSSGDTGTATWEEGKSLDWPNDDATTSVEVIVFCPAVETLPETVSCMDGKTYKMDYISCPSNNKPVSFTFTHLMAQLEVHIKINDETEHHHTPTDGSINLSIEGAVDYPNKKLIPAEMITAFGLGTFSKEDGGANSEENWTNTAQLVIPQTLQKGIPCLTFKAGDKTYTFTPEEDIVLTAGKITKLYLGVAYENDYVTLGDITVTDWVKNTINIGEIEEEIEQ